jgi:3-deoxy-D-arabino-heptulosonate 7-phosphate (DAHP) synthase
MKKRIVIAGPCAAESEEQIDIAIREVLNRDIVRRVCRCSRKWLRPV